MAAGVVDQNVDLSEIDTHTFDHPFHGRLVGHIALNRDETLAGRRASLEASSSAGAYPNRRAGCAENACEATSRLARAPSDERDPAGEIAYC